MTVDKLLFPSRFCPSKHETLGALEVTFWGHSEELTEKRLAPRRVVVYVSVQRFINPREIEKSGNIEIGSNVGERFSGNVEEGCSAFWERRRGAITVKVSMLGCLEGDGFRVLVLFEGVSESFSRLIEHKLGGGKSTSCDRRHVEMTTIGGAEQTKVGTFRRPIGCTLTQQRRAGHLVRIW